MPKHKAVRDLTAAGIVKACGVFVPVNAPVMVAIDAHKLATQKLSTRTADRIVARHALRAVVLAAANGLQELQGQFDYLRGLPPEAWNGFPPPSREAVLSGLTRSITALHLN